ncbi:MAG TPA: hypothetical protein VJK52_03965 [Candidatus Nanoarchaeia archaeon]|nr:hypothetical protein [Candidatus Nanoarchaeia archaeon]
MRGSFCAAALLCTAVAQAQQSYDPEGISTPRPIHSQPHPPEIIALDQLPDKQMARPDYHEALRIFDQDNAHLWDLSLETESIPYIHRPLPPRRSEIALPDIADTVLIHDFLYVPQPDGSYDTKNLSYRTEVRKAKEYARRSLRDPIAKALEPVGHVRSKSTMGLTAEPFLTDRLGVEIESGSWRVRFGENYRGVRFVSNQWGGRVSLGFSVIDSERQFTFGFRKILAPRAWSR